MAKSSRGGRRGGGGGGGGVDFTEERSLISERENNETMVDDVLTTLREAKSEYGEVVGDLSVVKLTKKKDAGVIAFTDGENIRFNEAYFNAGLESAYDQTVKSGLHPSRGSKTATEAVIAHELGHNLTQTAGINMGKKFGGRTQTIGEAAKRICEEARKITGDKGVVIMARKISGYAVESNAECVAEAVNDVYCNGSKAKKQSKAIVEVLKKYL